MEKKRKVTFEQAVELGQRLGVSAVFETSALSNSQIDEVFNRSIVNCVDLYTVSGENPLVSKRTGKNGMGGRSRIFSTQTELNRKISFGK